MCVKNKKKTVEKNSLNCKKIIKIFRIECKKAFTRKKNIFTKNTVNYIQQQKMCSLKVCLIFVVGIIAVSCISSTNAAVFTQPAAFHPGE